MHLLPSFHRCFSLCCSFSLSRFPCCTFVVVVTFLLRFPKCPPFLCSCAFGLKMYASTRCLSVLYAIPCAHTLVSVCLSQAYVCLLSRFSIIVISFEVSMLLLFPLRSTVLLHISLGASYSPVDCSGGGFGDRLEYPSRRRRC